MVIFSRYREYLRAHPEQLWFKRKTFGWGWTPVRWQGWLVIGLYAALIAFVFARIDASSHSVSDTMAGVFLPFIGLTLILIALCYATGEEPGWQWGTPATRVALIIFLAFCAVVIVVLGKVNTKSMKPAVWDEQPVQQFPEKGIDEKNTVYDIDNVAVWLHDGVSQVPAAPGSATMVTTRYFGNEVRTDLNGDGRQDVVFLLTQQAGGSGTFYYVTGALNTENGYVGLYGVLLGDRIAPQTTSVDSTGIISVNYADRNPGESFAVKPSMAKTLRLKFSQEDMQFGVVANNFEGEANPAQMTLATNDSWRWIETRYSDGRLVKPQKPDSFTLHFRWDGVFSGTTDCNSLSGNTARGADNVLTFERIAATEMYCADSQQAEYSAMLDAVSRYRFTSRGELILLLRYGTGEMIFR